MTATLIRPSPTPVAASTRLPRLRSLDGLRGIAAMLVVLGHSHLDSFSQGFLGVDIFFVLSGFLITTLLVQRPQSYRGFLAHRAARLVPALLVALLVMGVQQNVTGGLDDHCLALSMTHTMDISALGANSCAGTWHVTWSLAFEEQFYVLWPLVLIVLVRRSRRYVGFGLAGVWLLNATRMAMLTTHHEVTDTRLLYSPDGRALSILLGCAVAMVCADPLARAWLARHRSWSVAPIVVGLLLAVAPFVPHAATNAWGADVRKLGGDISLASAVGLGTALLIFGLVWAGEGSPVARLFSWRPLVGMGAISYSLYLLHLVPITVARAWFPGRTLFDAAVGIGAAVILATASRHLVERPFQRWAHGLGSPA